MEKRIPIDELFHDKLSQGKEQINLGAWANMERMLDGKNPYADEDKKKRRGFIPFLLLILVTTGIVGAGYLLKFGTTKKSDSNTYVSNTYKSDYIQNNNTVSKDNENLSQSKKYENTINTTSKKKNDLNNNTNLTNFSNQELVSETNNESNTSNSSSSLSNTNNSKIESTVSKVNKNDKASNENNINSSSPNQIMTSNNEKINSKKTKTSTKQNSVTNQNSFSEETNSNNKQVANIIDINNKENAIKPTKVIEKIPVVTVNQKNIRNRDGSLKSTIDDTISKSTFEKVTEVDETITASIDPMISNPRYKNLSEEEERNVSLQSQQTDENIPTIQLKSEAASPQPVSEISIASNQKNKASKHTGYFQDLRKFFINTYNKINNYMIYRPKPDVYTGLNLGVNASLSNSNNNHGGFHGGFVMLRPVNEYLSFITELKFYYRRNGGYTASDIHYKILENQPDNITLVHDQKTIYSYQKDSTITTHNFKNFYSLELPLMIQLNNRFLSFYGGLNVAYSFKLKTTEKSKNYAPIYEDTLANVVAYSFPTDKGSDYVRSDFGSRFGLGYTVGAAYNFTPQLYFDLRVTQNVWDNMKTNVAREISKGFFKVPSIQISLGYRFRKFTAGN